MSKHSISGIRYPHVTHMEDRRKSGYQREGRSRVVERALPYTALLPMRQENSADGLLNQIRSG